MSASTSSDSSQTVARKKQRTKLWNDELVRIAAQLERILALDTLEHIRLQRILDLDALGEVVDEELQQLSARVSTMDDNLSRLVKAFLIPVLQAFKTAIGAHSISPPLHEPFPPSQPSVSPSSYAKSWTKYQKKNNPKAHRCLRPPELMGLPLELLHPAFGTFLQTLKDPYPSPSTCDPVIRPTIIWATKAAANLCAEMGCDYEDEKARGLAFIAALDPLFHKDGWMNEYYISSSNKGSARIDGVYFDEGKIRILREVRSDAPTREGEPYIQLIHSYRWAVSRTHQSEPSHQKHGSPMLLFLVRGTELLIAGAVFDGKAVVAEPLGPSVPMLNDWTYKLGNRRDVLAHHLYAARRAYDELMRGSFDVPYRPVVPHPDIYPSRIESSEGLVGHFVFKSPHPYWLERTLLFTGTINWDPVRPKTSSPINTNEMDIENETSSNLISDPRPPNPVVIKLVCGSYGENLHKHLASAGLAPKLYGVIEYHLQRSHADMPRAVVMEDLPSPTPTKAGWKPLWTFLKASTSEVVQTKIFEVIVQIAVAIMKHKSVHGDLRSPNLMVYIPNEYSHDVVLVNERAQLKLIDFDWAGPAGEVYYPFLRNTSVKWPGEDGEVISAGDDWKLIKNWWSAEFPGFDMSPYDESIQKQLQPDQVPPGKQSQ